MNLTDIINFLTTESLTISKTKDFYECTLYLKNNTISTYGFNPLEAVCNCYTKWKNIEISLTRGIQNLSQ